MVRMQYHVLQNESHTLPSQNDGTVVSFDGATTDMEVFEGTCK